MKRTRTKGERGTGKHQSARKAPGLRERKLPLSPLRPSKHSRSFGQPDKSAVRALYVNGPHRSEGGFPRTCRRNRAFQRALAALPCHSLLRRARCRTSEARPPRSCRGKGNPPFFGQLEPVDLVQPRRGVPEPAKHLQALPACRAYLGAVGNVYLRLPVSRLVQLPRREGCRLSVLPVPAGAVWQRHLRPGRTLSGDPQGNARYRALRRRRRNRLHASHSRGTR